MVLMFFSFPNEDKKKVSNRETTKVGEQFIWKTSFLLNNRLAVNNSEIYKQRLELQRAQYFCQKRRLWPKQKASRIKMKMTLVIARLNQTVYEQLLFNWGNNELQFKFWFLWNVFISISFISSSHFSTLTLCSGFYWMDHVSWPVSIDFKLKSRHL